MKNNELNTSQFSLERIYKYDIFLEYSFDNNNAEKNITEIPKFLLNAATKASNDKYENWCIKPSNGDDDYDSALYAAGYRLENDREYNDRISTNLTHMKIAYENYLRRKPYYDGGVYHKEIAEMTSILNKLK